MYLKATLRENKMGPIFIGKTICTNNMDKQSREIKWKWMNFKRKEKIEIVKYINLGKNRNSWGEGTK